MNWLLLLLPIGAALLYTLRMFIENYLTDRYFKRERISPDVLVIPGAISLILTILVLVGMFGFDVFRVTELSTVWWLLLAGAINILAFIPYYKAYNHEEVTGITIMSQLSPVFALGLAALFLGEVVDFWQGVAFVLIFGAICLLIFETSTRRARKMELKTAVLMVITCLFWSLSDVVYTPEARDVGFETSFAWFLIGELVSVLILTLIMKPWRRGFGKFLKRHRTRKLVIVTGAEVAYAGAEVLLHAALIVMPIAIVAVIDHVFQLILAFGLGLIFTILLPKFSHEKIRKRTILHHLAAVIIVIVGIVLLELA
jgi:drug/metabolite transporter (DMT)-like permease